MIAYLTKTRAGYVLAICARPCNGEEYTAAQRLNFPSKREARAYCKANAIQPWNF